jgi:Flp pilus assembly protein TadD
MTPVADLFESAKKAFAAGNINLANVAGRQGFLLSPGSVTGATLHGIVSSKRNDIEQARRGYRWAIPASGGADPRAFANLAKFQEIVGELDDAVKTCTDGLALYPQDPALADHAVRLALRGNHFRDAARLAVNSIKARPEDHRISCEISAVIVLKLIEEKDAEPDWIHVLLRAALAKPTQYTTLCLQAAAKYSKTTGQHPTLQIRAGKRALLHDPHLSGPIANFAEALEARQQMVRAAAWYCQLAVMLNDSGSLCKLAARKALTAQWPWRALGRLFVLEAKNPTELSLLESFVHMFSLFQHDEEKDHAVSWSVGHLEKNSDDPRFWDAALRTLHFIGRDDAAEPYWPAALRRFPDSHVLFHNRALFLQDTRRNSESGDPVLRSLLLKPDYDRAYNIIAMYFATLNESEKAIRSIRRALAISPTKSPYWMNLGTFKRGKQDLSGGLRAFRQAEKFAPGLAEPRFNIGLTSLMLGELHEGFRNYQDRWNLTNFPSTPRRFPHPNWLGPVEHPDARVLVYMEQGMGDEVMFSWYFKWLAGDAREVVVDCDGRLIGIFKRTYPSIVFHPRPTDMSIFELDKKAHLETADFKIAGGDLPQHYVPEIKAMISENRQDFQRRGVRREPRLKVDPERLALWKKRLKDRFGDKPVIGISWRSSYSTSQRDAQYVSIEELAKSISADVGVINLQYSFREEEHDRLEALSRTHGFDFHTPREIDLKDDLDDIFAILQACDACVTPMISLAWMSGMVGTPTWVYRTAGELRTFHMLGTPFMPWAPSIKMFFRKPRTSWDPVIEAIHASVLHLAETGEAADVQDPSNVPMSATW